MFLDSSGFYDALHLYKPSLQNGTEPVSLKKGTAYFEENRKNSQSRILRQWQGDMRFHRALEVIRPSQSNSYDSDFLK